MKRTFATLLAGLLLATALPSSVMATASADSTAATIVIATIAIPARLAGGWPV